MGRVDGKCAVVTGGASGIGRATCLLLAAEGARTAVADIDEESGTRVVREIESQGGRAAFWRVDVTREAEIEDTFAEIEETFGGIDVLVNNAGNFYAGFFEELSPEQFEAQLTTNLLGPLNVTREVLPVMRKQRSGHVVTISSTAGIVGQEFCSAYAASKFGLEGWMESLRYEVEPFGIHTTIVEPGFFRTDLLTKESTAYAE
ncbi:MAG TPA: SDR family NAD(P)-dependent oxidoreductase, partial [Thermoanaerobaculia bacterium]